VDVRIVAATNQELAQLVRDKRFREDLYYRLNVITISVPPLRERREDVRLLAEHFLRIYAAKNNRKLEGVSDEALERLEGYAWPGNVRELENTLMRAAVLARGRTITLDDLAFSGTPHAPADGDVPPLDAAVRRHVRYCLEELRHGASPGAVHAAVMAAVERPLFEVVLEESGGNQLRAARILGLNRNTLRKKITELGVAAKRPAKPRDGS
jgi:two-component system nitrogen regulation response regulator GlnG